MGIPLAHIAEFATRSSAIAPIAAASVAFFLVLTLEHLHVKHAGITRQQLLRVVAGAVTVATLSIVAPAGVTAQETSAPVGLPDLISDPPFITAATTVVTPQGDLIRALTFDGHVHNIGTGSLEISGNPQIEGGMQQLVFDGQDWNPVGTPTVVFENSDGHNHFHLMEAIHYALWTDGRSEQVSNASKIGFCLIDTELREEGFSPSYLIDSFNYCGVDDPDATELTMGITPGWRDTYGSTVTLQWIDISSTAPGRYWISAVTDPNNEIVESNEDNNDIVFSENRFSVDGYVARELSEQQADSPIQLKSIAYGILGAQAFVIEDAPSNGSLDVPIGFDLVDLDTVVYTPNPGFSGSDSFTYYAQDTASIFPDTPTLVEVIINVPDSDDTTTNDTTADSPAVPEIADVEAQQVTVVETVDLELQLQDELPPGVTVEWFAADLPPGLVLNRDTGMIRGVPTFAGEYETSIVVVAGAQTSESQISWSVADQDFLPLSPLGDMFTTSFERTDITFGTANPNATYRGIGFPMGVSVVPNQPRFGGLTQEAGTFNVVVEEVVDDEVVNSIEFTWVVAPTTRPGFPL